MTPLRQKMINDMKLRRFALGTQKLYVYAVKDLARYYHRSPDLIREEEVHVYLLYLQEEKKLEWGSCNCMAAGLNFFYKTTLKEKNINFKIPKRKQTRKLPTIFSRSDLIKLFDATYSLSLKENAKDVKTIQNTILPDQNTYKNVREYAEFIISEVEKGNSSVFKKTLTLREFSTYFGPEWWTKLFVDNHYIIEDKCVGCGTCVEKCPTGSIDLDTFSVNTDACVLCFGCINNCEYLAVNMEYSKEKVMGFNEFLKKNNLKFELPAELKT